MIKISKYIPILFSTSEAEIVVPTEPANFIFKDTNNFVFADGNNFIFKERGAQLMADQSLDLKTEATTLGDTAILYALAGVNDRKIQASNLATTLESKMAHPTSDGSSHSFIDQDVTSGSGPSFTNSTLTTPTITLNQGAAPTPTAEGDIQWDTDDNTIKIGDGTGTKTFSDDSVNSANYQPLDTQLTTIAGLTPASSLLIGDGLGDWTTVTPANFITNNSIITTTNTNTLTNKTITDISNTIHSNLVYFSARNSSGAQIDKGTAVYVSGYNVGQDLVEIDKADSDNASALPCAGIVEDDISNNSNGKVIQTGVLNSFDTSAYSVGDELFVSTTPGALTNTKPTGDADSIQKVAIVIRSNIATGALAVFGAGRVNDVPNKIDQKTLVLKQGAAPTPTAEGDIQWDTDDNTIKIGDGASTKTFSDDVTKASSTETLTNKTIDGDDNTVQDLTTSVFKTGTLETTATDSDSAIPTSGALFDHVAEIDFQTQTGTTYTLVLGDKGKCVTMDNASANTLTIPANASVAFPVGTQIEIAQLGAGQTTIAITTDTLNSSGGATKLSGQYSTAVITKLTTTSWIMAGDITT